MDNDELAHLKEKYRISLKRLRALELKYAWQGPNTPADILLEIDELRETIIKLQSQIDFAENPTQTSITSKQTEPSAGKGHIRRRLQIVFDGDFSGITPEIRDAAIRSLAAIINIPPDEIAVLRVAEGSIVFDIELPAASAYTLVKLYQSDDATLKSIGVKKISIIPDNEQIEELDTFREQFWSYINSFIKNEAERVVLDSVFSFGLPPRLILEQHPDLFTSVKDIYNIKRNILARLSRNRELRRLIEFDEKPSSSE